jgi:hypothetical protein
MQRPPGVVSVHAKYFHSLIPQPVFRQVHWLSPGKTSAECDLFGFTDILRTLYLDCYPFIDFNFYDAVSTDDHLTTDT